MTHSITKTPVSWDKATYYFSKINNNFDYIWYIEDDVFIPNSNAIYNLDNKYKDYDLLTRANNISFDYNDRLNGGHWHLARNMLRLPLFGSMVCALRISKNLLNKVNEFRNKHNRLLFIEIMFNTLCSQNKLKNKIVPELITIAYRYDWKYNLIKENFLYHPIKDLEVQKNYYEKFNNCVL